MGHRGAAAGTDHTQPRTVGDRDVARALALLEGDQAGPITIAALRERGVKAPAQAVYTLQLAGYGIDRVSCEDPDGRRTLGYRLHRPSGPVSDRLAGPREAGAEEA
jgi:hypothetical protein